ncbi:hypothetical protein WCD74_16565 [Actinomycetospora sp. OC33-EN08]|uniref:Helix-turn-helix domain-containing protein n=1 Tax=Actinomycetospora aurantiaca TaxID=3129233 RepID=A0ABU8MR33_9PSEU
MYSESQISAALELHSAGLHATEIGRRLDVPKSTVQYWCRGGRRELRRREPPSCPRCHSLPLNEWEYAYLLGGYLGDGHITTGEHRSTVLWLYCADDWPGVSAEFAAAMAAVLPDRSVHRSQRTGCHALQSRSRHWLCLFPQHGHGLKHRREIALEPWQQAIVDEHPDRFLRGLFHSDGCRIINWATKKTSQGTKRYEYPRYMFSNKSEHILAMCEAALDRLDIAHRRPRKDLVSVARRPAVGRLDEFVGPKY